MHSDSPETVYMLTSFKTLSMWGKNDTKQSAVVPPRDAWRLSEVLSYTFSHLTILPIWKPVILNIQANEIKRVFIFHHIWQIFLLYWCILWNFKGYKPASSRGIGTGVSTSHIWCYLKMKIVLFNTKPENLTKENMKEFLKNNTNSPAVIF